MHTSVAIIGGGLSGLSLARLLHRADIAFELFEARDRLGGRVFTQSGYDMGPSWFWPGQPRMAALVAELGLTVFEQFATGALSYETETGAVMRDMGFASMQGSLRLNGGKTGLIDGIAAQLPKERLHLAHPATRIEPGRVIFEQGMCDADHIVLATPPRVAAGLTFDPELPGPAQKAFQDVPTWMGGHAKFVAIYDSPFWRKDGLSGDAMSRHGPLGEIHDASPSDGSQGALFGFLGVPAPRRAGQDAAIVEAAVAQLARIFGPKAATPITTHYQDWAYDPFTASVLDHAPLNHHPTYGMPHALNTLWDGHLHMCSTEVAPEMGGYLEGALAAAEHTARMLATATVP